MTTNKLIWSDRLRFRIARHGIFWMVWWVYFIVTFLLPTFQFHGYTSITHNPYIEKYGVLAFIKEVFIFKSFVAVIVPHIAYTYLIIYFGLPRFFLAQRKQLKDVFIFLGWCICIYLASIFLMYVPFYRNFKLGLVPGVPSLIDTLNFLNKSYIFHLPLVLSYAIMIKLTKLWWRKERETEQLLNEKIIAELQLLKAQVHPHFLFNTLNNIYSFTLSASPQAPVTIKRLIALLHYIIYECEDPKVPLEKELRMIQDYIALEKIRYGEQLKISFEIKGKCTHNKISPLLLIPFVENSFKHGASKMLLHPWIEINIEIEDDELSLLIKNSTPVHVNQTGKNGNIGLNNVKKRLQLLYPGCHEMNIISEGEQFTIFLKIRLSNVPNHPNTYSQYSKPGIYATA